MIICADVLEWAATYTGPKFHAMLDDPPYHLTSITDRFGKQGAAPAQFGSDGAFQRASKGFMNAKWDGGDIAFRPETWAALAEHLYPGAWGMSFAGSRGWHRMACAIEDAGLIMQPTIFGWSYGNGFPKATRIDTQIDAAAFRAWLRLHPEEDSRIKAARLVERAARRAQDKNAMKETRAELQALTVAYKALAGLTPNVVGQKRHQPKFAAAELGYREKDNGFNSRERETFDITEAATDAARYWLGHRYGGQVLKPAIEPIIVFQKPYSDSPLENITTTGAGALWIDGGRIGTDGETWSGNQENAHNNYRADVFGAFGSQYASPAHPAGRWPSNLVLSHSPSCNGHCAPGCPVAAMGAQSGQRAVSGAVRTGNPAHTDKFGMFSGIGQETGALHNDSGTAARFFYQAEYMYERIELADAIQYVAKAGRSEREAGLDPKQTAIMRLLDDSDDDAAFEETTVDDGRAVPIDNPYQRGETTRRNIHPTIKPISLTRYLATLLLPPPEYGPRRLMVPFSGAGSEVIGADLAGWEEVVGIELGADHVAIAEARREYWRQRRWELGDPARKLTVKAAPKVPAGQMDMF